ncbi:MAG: putative domain lipoprotein [Acidobacteria bacterium]|nr:putative domain lipoprotein [Acidobacteriota bacterium]
MDFVLRPGERLIRYFAPEAEDAFYLPYKYGAGGWTEFPQEVAEYAIRTEDGPRSQRDDRRWATGKLEYRPILSSKDAYYPAWGSGDNSNLLLPDPNAGGDYLGRREGSRAAQALFEMQSPYVLIDARLSLRVFLRDSNQSLRAEISLDGGRNWGEMALVKGPFEDVWQAEPSVILRSQHGRLTAVSGRYGYLIRLSMLGNGAADSIRLRDIEITSRFELNPRTLPALGHGRNELQYRAGAALQRRPFPVRIDRLSQYACHAAAVRCVTEGGQNVLWPDRGQTAEIIFELAAPDGSPLSSFDAGSRFLDLRDGLAPDKLTAETRRTSLGGQSQNEAGSAQASLAWSVSMTGGYRVLWQYDQRLPWLDGKPVNKLLRWPEVDRRVTDLPNKPLGSHCPVGADRRHQPLCRVKLAIGVLGLDNTVRVEHHDVSGLQSDTAHPKIDIGQHPHDRPSLAEPRDVFRGAQDEGRRMSGVRVLQCSAGRIQPGIEDCYVPGLAGQFKKDPVQCRQDLAGPARSGCIHPQSNLN